MTARLEVKNIDVYLDGKQIVDDLSFSLPDGKIGCLLGPSGCGKTTVLRTIAGFESPVKGQVLISNKVVADKKNRTPPERRNIGMVFQDFALFPHIDVAENIRFGIHAWPLK